MSRFQDWQTVLDFVGKNYVIIYTEDGEQRAPRAVQDILRTREERSVLLEVLLPGFTVSTHFSRHNRVEMDLRPEDINTSEKGRAVFSLMSG